MDEVEIAHALSITKGCYAEGRTIESLDLNGKEVPVVSLRRQYKDIIDPQESTVLMADDTLIIRGKIRKIKKAEKFLLKGV